MLEHAAGEVHRDHTFEPFGQVRQEDAGPAAKVGHRLARGVGYGRQRGPQRIFHVRAVRIEEHLIILLGPTTPLAILVVEIVYSQSVVNLRSIQPHWRSFWISLRNNRPRFKLSSKKHGSMASGTEMEAFSMPIEASRGDVHPCPLENAFILASSWWEPEPA